MGQSYKHLFTETLRHIPAHSHAVAHSHHLRPNVVADAQKAAAEDGFRLADRKWEKIFTDIYPKAQGHIARLLKTGQPDNVVFAPNTHEFVLRLLSGLPQDRPPRILTTDSEFYSAGRQFQRLEEDQLIEITRIATQPFETFPARFSQAAAESDFDMVFLSHVFFNSGYVIPALNEIVGAVAARETLIVIDGYHSVMALPVSLYSLKDRVFYMSGAYKYVMAGEGACFMHVPDGYVPRPVNTGWFAGFDTLGDKKDGPVQYSRDATRFAGSTFDPSALYRLNAVMEMLEKEEITVADIHAHVTDLQERFITGLQTVDHPDISVDTLLIDPREHECAHFLTFETDKAAALHEALDQHGLLTDYRGDRLRFGFGIYHDPDDIYKMLDTVKKLL